MPIFKLILACLYLGSLFFGIISFAIFFISLAKHFINIHEINRNQRGTLEFDLVELFVPKIILSQQSQGQMYDDDANQVVKWFWRTVITFLFVLILYAIMESISVS